MDIRTFFARILVVMTLAFVVANLVVLSVNYQSRQAFWALTEAHQFALRWQEARETVVQSSSLGEALPVDVVDMVSALPLPLACCQQERARVLRGLQADHTGVGFDDYRASASWEQLLRSQRLALQRAGEETADRVAIRNWMIPGLSSLALAMVLLITWSILNRRLILPTQKLAVYVNRLLRGRQSQSLNLTGVPTELIGLYDAFELTIGDYRGQLSSQRERSAEMSQESDLLEMQIQSLVELSVRPAFVVDVSGAVRTWNRQMISLTGLSKNQSLRSVFAEEFLDAPSREIFGLAMQTARLGKLPDEFRCELALQGGRRVPIAIQLSPQIEPGLGVNRVLGVLRVEQDEQEAERSTSTESALADHGLLEMVAALQSGVQWWSQVESASETEWRRRIAAFSAAVAWLAEQRYERVNSTLDALEIVAHVGSIVSARCQDLDIQQETAINADHAWVSANAGALVEVLSAVCDNAIEAIEAKDMGVRRLRLSADTRNGWLNLKVSDTGAGVRDTDRHQLFQPFFTTKADRGSHGLGLTHTKCLLERAGGEIELTSSVMSSGCTVTIKLPIKEVSG